jgi:hypothetical protein
MIFSPMFPNCRHINRLRPYLRVLAMAMLLIVAWASLAIL